MRKAAQTKIFESVDKTLLQEDERERKFNPVITVVVLLIALIVSIFTVYRAMAEELTSFNTDRVFICSHDGKTVNGFLVLSKGADEELSDGYSYTKEEIRNMLEALGDRSGSSVDFASALDDVYKWHLDTGADVAAMCALLYSEEGYKNSNGVKHWNFFNLTPPKNGKFYLSGGRRLWDAKKECKTVGEALVRGMDRIYAWYWVKGQDSFYKMAFNGYGYPATTEEAEQADARIFHSYLPWWEDTAYIKSGYDSNSAWVNRLAAYREKYLKVSGYLDN